MDEPIADTSPVVSVVPSIPAPDRSPVKSSSNQSQAIFGITILLIILSLFNSYKAIAVIYTLNAGAVDAGSLPYNEVTAFPILLFLPIVYTLILYLYLFGALKIKSHPQIGVKLTLIISLVNYFILILFGFITYYQFSKFTEIFTK